MTHDTTQRSGGTATLTAPSSAAWGLIKVNDIVGRNVIGLSDEHIGTIGDVYLDHSEHTIRYCTVDVGGFLGIGIRTVLIPFEKLQWSGEDLYLAVDKQVLENAPEFDPMAQYDRSYEETVVTAWGVPTYWTAPTYGADHSHWREGYGWDERPELRHDRRSL
jgi:sporulation protein YlmC with PRC-barrel domain